MFYINKLVIYSLCLTLFGCVNHLKDQSIGHTTHINTSYWALNSNLNFHVFNHNNRNMINTCKKTLDVFQVDKIKVTILTPCSYKKNFKKLWFSNKNIGQSFKDIAELYILNLSSLFKGIGAIDNLHLNLQIILVPNNKYYHFDKSYFQSDYLNLFMGLPIEKNKNNIKVLADQLIDILSHELTHVIDFKKYQITEKLILEKRAHLAGYCASKLIGKNRSYILSSSNFIYNEKLFRQMNDQKINDSQLNEYIKIKLVEDNHKKIEGSSSVSLSVDQLAIFTIQRHIFNLLGHMSQVNLNDKELSKVYQYCQNKLKENYRNYKIIKN